MIHFDITKQEQELSELEKKTVEPNFWDDTKTANNVLDKIKSIKNKCLKYRQLETDLLGIKDIIDLLKMEEDENLANEMVKDIKKIEKGNTRAVLFLKLSFSRFLVVIIAEVVHPYPIIILKSDFPVSPIFFSKPSNIKATLDI